MPENKTFGALICCKMYDKKCNKMNSKITKKQIKQQLSEALKKFVWQKNRKL